MMAEQAFEGVVRLALGGILAQKSINKKMRCLIKASCKPNPAQPTLRPDDPV
jgi:hypothetical protein